MRHCLVNFACAFIFLAPAICVAQTIDPHAVFEEYCSRCHTPHGGDFARQELTTLPGGPIIGRKTLKPLDSFLIKHPGGLSLTQISALIDMFMIQLRSGGLYERKCRICHDSAKKLARVRLEMKNGKLVDRITARDIHDFLKGHGRLNTREVEVINKMLIWQLRTAGR